jgi:hypothetical protein
MICRELNCLFVHVPKTAGQSVEHFLMAQMGLNMEEEAHRRQVLLYRNLDRSRGTQRLAHLSAAEYVEDGYLAEDEFNSFFRFAFVRNPWTRLLSEYLYRNYLNHMSFRKFVLRRMPKPGWHDEYRHVMPQYDMLYRKGRLMVDFVGRFESLQSDFDRVCERLGLQDSTLPHRNPSEKRSRTLRRKVRNWLLFNGENSKRGLNDFYDDDTRQAVADYYRKDIETWGYQYPG